MEAGAVPQAALPVMNTASHILHGLWRCPQAEQLRFNSLDLWVDLVKTLERGNFDVIFFADVHGVYGRAGGSHRKYVESGLQIPSNDPSVILSALAYHTEHLGLAFTNSIVQEHPFNFARKISTLDHASQGRIAWNIVTNSLTNGARNCGFDDLTPHDERYAWAEKYMEVTYKLWEGPWDDGALLQDRALGLHGDPTKVHRINHSGKRYRVEGPHLVAPSPQRTPYLFQAGASPAGMRFGAAHAEAQFLITPSPTAAAALISQMRALLPSFGRKPTEIKFFQGLSFVIGSSEEEARRKDREHDEGIDQQAMIMHLGAGLDLDLESCPLDLPIAELETEGVKGLLDWVRGAVQGREPTVRDIGLLASRASRVTGTPEQIADQLAIWQEAGIDGINVINATIPGSYEEFIDFVMPVLRRRGLARNHYEAGSLRHKLSGRDTVPPSHPAARYRGAFS